MVHSGICGHDDQSRSIEGCVAVNLDLPSPCTYTGIFLPEFLHEYCRITHRTPARSYPPDPVKIVISPTDPLAPSCQDCSVYRATTELHVFLKILLWGKPHCYGGY